MEYSSAFPSDWSTPAASSPPGMRWDHASEPVATSIFTSYNESYSQESEANSDLAFYQLPDLASQGVITRDFAYRTETSRIDPAPVTSVTPTKMILRPSDGQDKAIDEPRRFEIRKRVDFADQKPAETVEPDGRIARYETEFPQGWSLPPQIRKGTERATTAAFESPPVHGFPSPVLEERSNSNSSENLFQRPISQRAQPSRSLGEAAPYLHGRRSKSFLIPRERLEQRRYVVTEHGDALERKLHEGSATAYLIGMSVPILPRQKANSVADVAPTSNDGRYRTESDTSTYSTVDIPERRRTSQRDTPPKLRRTSSSYSKY
jgi:hypothetical protein